MVELLSNRLQDVYARWETPTGPFTSEENSPRLSLDGYINFYDNLKFLKLYLYFLQLYLIQYCIIFMLFNNRSSTCWSTKPEKTQSST